VRVRDDEGHEGLGYCHAIPAISTHGEGARAGLAFLVPMLVGRSLDELGAVLDELDATLAYQPTVKAAIDMALHDLLARAMDVPVHVLLGGRQRERVALSRILPIKAPDEMGALARQLAGQGYGQLKLKLSGDTDLDIQRLAAVREAVGPDVVLTLDPNQSYSPKQLISAFSRMERHAVALIEQPVPAADFAGLKLLTQACPWPSRPTKPRKACATYFAWFPSVRSTSSTSRPPTSEGCGAFCRPCASARRARWRCAWVPPSARP